MSGADSAAAAALSETMARLSVAAANAADSAAPAAAIGADDRAGSAVTTDREAILDSQKLRSSRTNFLTVSERPFVESIAAPSAQAFEVVCQAAMELVTAWEREVRFLRPILRVVCG